MGIFRYFRYITKKYPGCYTTIKKKYPVPQNTLENPDAKGVECVLFDLNAIIHPCFQKVFEYGTEPRFLKNPKMIELQRKKETMTYEELERWAFNMITKKMDEIIYYTKPTRVIYIAIDGSPGSSKSNQQRQRRFKNAANPHLGKFSFDPNSLTCGTELMDRLCKHIFFFIKRKKQHDWKSLRVIFNDMFVPGEGENKLKLWIESEPQYNSVTIISPDGDVIMLAMLLERDEVKVFRENIFDDIDGDYFFIDVIKLKELVYNQLRGACEQNLLQPQRTIKDYVLFHFFIGNDFLPHIPSIEINNNGINLLYKCYNETCSKHGFLIEERLSEIHINKTSFTGLVKELAKYEIKLLIDKYNLKVTYPDKLLSSHMLRTDEGANLDFPNYRKSYYISKFKLSNGELDDDVLERQIKTICEEYIIGLTFVLKYYFREIPTYDWQYPYHYAPLLFDLAKYSDDFDFNISFTFKRPLNVYESLFSVLPVQSFSLLPSEVVDRLPDKIKLDPRFSVDFEIDLDGKMYDYEGVFLLDFLSYERVKKYFTNIKLSKEKNDYLISRAKVYSF